MRKILLLVICIVFSDLLLAQIGTQFWFAVPDVGDGGGTWNPSLDTPMLFRISTYENAATVTISVPANPSFNGGNPIQQVIPANSMATIDVSSFEQLLSCFHDNSNQNNGVLITATQTISVYYEVASANNSELWSLKGENALGTAFYIPGQKAFLNHTSYNNLRSPYHNGTVTRGGYNSFNVLATQNATTVYIYDNSGNTVPIITTTLNAGQTYTVQDFTRLTPSPLAGYRVTSNKPIAITVTDDLLRATFGNNGQDVGGDQIIPITKIGTEYIAGRGNLTISNGDNITVLATQNGTTVNRDGNFWVTLNEGESYNFNLNGASSAYITSNAPIYVSQLSSLNGEIGWDVLPPIICTGSSEVAYTRSASGDCNLILVTQSGHESNFLFLVNGTPATINPVFSNVPGTAGQWKSTSLNISSALVVNSVLRVLNTSGLFHMGVVNGVNGAGGRFGYFSDFGLLTVTPFSNNPGCTDDTLKLFADHYQGADYLWTGPNGFSSILQNPVITPVTDINSGTYILRVTLNGCSSTDSVIVNTGAIEHINIGNDTIYCGAFTKTLDIGNGNNSVLWSTGSTASSITVNNPGIYWAEVSSQCGTMRDSIIIEQREVPIVNLGVDTILCTGGLLMLSDTTLEASHLWSTGQTTPSINVNTSGTYWLEVTKNGCSARDSINISFHSPPTDISIGNDTIYCGAFTKTLDIGNGNNSVLWSTGSTASSITVNNPGIYWAEVSNQCGTVRDSIAIIQNISPIIDIGNDTIIACLGDVVVLDATTANATYLWQDNSTNSSYAVTTNGQYRVDVTVDGCIGTDSSWVFFVSRTSAVEVDSTICVGDTLFIGTEQPFSVYSWNSGVITGTLYVTSGGSYTQTVTNACGQTINSYNVSTKECECRLIFPTAFSPNDDGNNDDFGPIYQCPLTQFQIHIYNRWGELVFSSDNPNVRWNGEYKYTPQPIDSYVYYYKYTNPYTYKQVVGDGNVTLLR